MEPPVSLVVPDLSASAGLVYVVADPESPSRTDIWRARLSDGAVQPLMQTADRDETRPAWSDRASALAVWIADSRDGTTPPRRGLVLWKEEGEIELPGQRAPGELWPAWSPLDTRLTYVMRGFDPPGGGDRIEYGVSVVDLEHGDQRILVTSPTRGDRYLRPTFSPDGRRVVVEYQTLRGAARIVLLDGEGEPKTLTGDEYRAFGPRFTRDGRYILFSRHDRRGEPRDLVRIRPDGSDPQVIASTPESDDFRVASSPTRDELAFLSDRDGKLDAFLVDLEGGPPRNLTASLRMNVRKLRWSPDGEQLALVAYPRDSSPFEKDQRGAGRARAQVLVIDRQGRLLFQTSGYAPDWMPPWG